MKIHKVNFKNKTLKVIFSSGCIEEIQFETFPSHFRPGESVFVKSLCGAYLLKVRVDRFFFNVQPFKWFSRFVLRKLIFRPESKKESRANRLMKKYGLTVVNAYGWGGVLNPFNPAYSFYLMQNMGNLRTIKYHLPYLAAEQINLIVNKIISDIEICVINGFSPSDVTPANILLEPDGSLLWIDTNIEFVNKNFLTKSFVEYEILRHWPPNLAILLKNEFYHRSLIR
jgi:hypothetical protein